MRSISSGFYQLIHNPSHALGAIWESLSPVILSDRLYIKVKFRLKMGYWPNLKHPETYSEKIQWLRLNNYKPIFTTMVDKASAKGYVSSRIGDEYIIPTLGVWEHFDDINFDSLPESFVLKCTHDSGGIVLCKNKNSLDKNAAKIKLERSLKRNYFYAGRDYPYKYVKPQIIAEKFMVDDNSEDLKDYKFFCFNGDPKLCQVISERGTNMSIDFFDKDWVHQPFHEPANYPFSKKVLEKPSNYAEMLAVAEKLSEGHPFLRVDLYSINEKIYFGELTFYPTGGMGGFDPVEWDKILGSWINLEN